MTTTVNRVFRRGLVAGLPFVLTAAPFGLVFGLSAQAAGLDFAQVMGMSVLVIAGAAQFTALAQMQDAAPVLMVVIAALAVNSRMAIYSAALAPHLGKASLPTRALAAYILVDNAYAVAAAEFEARPDRPLAEKVAYYFGCAVPVWIAWYVSTFSGAWFGHGLPQGYALDFAVPIAFIAILAPMLRSLAHVAAALTSAVLGLALAWLPYDTGLLVAAALAMAVGAETERRSRA